MLGFRVTDAAGLPSECAPFPCPQLCCMCVCVSVLPHFLTTSSQGSKAKSSRWCWFALRHKEPQRLSLPLKASFAFAPWCIALPPKPKLSMSTANSPPFCTACWCGYHRARPTGNNFCLCFCLEACFSMSPMPRTISTIEPTLNMYP